MIHLVLEFLYLSIDFCHNCCNLYFIIGPDLTAANLLIAVKEVKDKWDELGNFLLVPDTVRNRIRKQHSTSLDRLDAVIKYVLELHPYVSWRLFIRALDRLSKHDLADKIRSFAEPVTGIIILITYRLHCLMTPPQ